MNGEGEYPFPISHSWEVDVVIQGVIFDMDGVLVDTEDFYRQQRERFLRERGIPFEEGRDFSGWNDEAVWEAIVPGDPALQKALLAEHHAYYQTHPIPFDQLANPQAKAVFSALKGRGLCTAIASSSERASIGKMIKTVGLEGLVDFVISGMECAAFKPDPDIYLRCVRALALRPGEVLVIEDSPVAIAAARNAGLRVFALQPRRGKELDQSAAVAILPELGRVLELLSL